MPKPQKRSPDLESKILGAIRRGLSMRKAAAACGVSEGTVRGWRDKDEEFANACESAIAQRELLCLDAIWKGERGWESKAWILERTNPDEYGRRQRIEQTGAGGGPVQITLVDEVAVKREGT